MGVLVVRLSGLRVGSSGNNASSHDLAQSSAGFTCLHRLAMQSSFAGVDFALVRWLLCRQALALLRIDSMALAPQGHWLWCVSGCLTVGARMKAHTSAAVFWLETGDVGSSASHGY